ncbi:MULTISPECIES: semialdehyde dehydrogenase [unclassified Deinococcus]|uniref:semialdehyde dehydrogenase n=1 Tax=unclassified Deinococcus TaxID=2623546 RepID=UPI001C2F5A4D|nr:MULTISPECIES: semialdehyde dehydrogenase [unclassified Deinococcus]MDK2014437.1 semialdehyde dehydrogenase [Deinococcus sp. 43]
MIPTLFPDRHPVAFLVHPRTDVAADLGGICRPLGWVPNGVYAAALRRLEFPSPVTGTLRFADDPARTAGWLITVPLTPRDLLSGGRRAQRIIGRAVDRAAQLGARTVGLGALTAPATAGGAALRHRTDIGVTNGNAFTAAMTLLGAQRLLDDLPGDALVAVVGATGSVGGCLTRLLAQRTPNPLLLVARNEARLRSLRASLPAGRAVATTDLDRVRDADLVILLTSAEDALLGSRHLKRGAAVLDDTQPRNTRPKLLLERPDVRIVDGGLVSVPGVQRRGFIGLPPGVAYACLAETLLLGLSGHRGHYSLGSPSPEQATLLLDVARQARHLGFTLAAPHSFGQPVTVTRRFESPLPNHPPVTPPQVAPRGEVIA